MNIPRVFLYCSLALILFSGWLFFGFNVKEGDFTERAKLALRYSGHELLLFEKDSTSLVQPVLEVAPFTYEVSFENSLSIDPSTLVTFIKSAVEKLKLPEHYRVQVVRCSDKEIAHSFEIKDAKENQIIPCKGRVLPKDCYQIQLKFTNKSFKSVTAYFFLFGLLLLIISFLMKIKPKKTAKKHMSNLALGDNCISIGKFVLNTAQNKLILDTEEIHLSQKECELLSFLAAHVNVVVKREELSKKIWEDHGVFVGRSLDTYVSKLRKKLKADKRIKITNIHGVGYKLEVKLV